MNGSFLRVLLICLSLFCLLQSCTPTDSVVIEHAWARPPAGSHQGTEQHDHSSMVNSSARTAVYMTIHNNGALSERLIKITSPSADTIEIHRSWTDEKGIMRMHPLDSVEIPPEQQFIFEPGGYHLMLVGVQPLQAGDSLALSLMFERGGAISTSAVIGHLDR